MQGHEAMDRREFLAGGMGAFVCWVLWPRLAPAMEAGRVVGRIETPGQQVRWQGPAASAWFIHQVDGRERCRRRVMIRTDGPPLVGFPIDRDLEPGEHEFLLEVGGRRVSCGGYRVAPFRFGC